MDTLKEITKKHILGNPIRLGITVYLLPRRRALFSELVEVLDVSPGNLDSHLRALKKKEYILIRKILADRPRTMVILTEKGAIETKKYLKNLRELLLSLPNTPEFLL